MEYNEKNKICKEKELKAIIVENIKPNNEGMQINLENLQAKNGSLTLKVQKNNTEYVCAHSLYNPQNEAEQIVSSLDFSKHGLFLIFGIGLAYHIELVLKKASDKSRIIIIEQSKKIFDNAMSNKDLSFILKDSRVMIFIGIEAQSIPIVIESINKGKSFLVNYAHSMQILELNSNRILFSNAIEVVKEIRRIAQLKWKMLGNCQVDHNIGVVQTVINIEHLLGHAGIDALREKYKSKSSVIVSAGPSLDKNIHLIKNLKGKSMIFAVDAVLGKLLKNDIIPDIVVTIERLEVYDNVFRNIGCKIPKEVVLLAPPLIEIETLEEFKENNKIMFLPEGVGTQEYFDKVLKKGLLATATSAAFTAINAAKEMGFAKIALVGQDLAYGKDGSIYCKDISKEGTETESERKQEEEYRAVVKDYEGNFIESNVLWKDQLISMEFFIKANPKIEFYDATEGGARVEGTKIIRLEEYIEKCLGETIESVNALLEKEKEKITENIKTELINNLHESIKKDLSRYKDLSDRIISHYEKIEKLQEKLFEEKGLNQRDIGKSQEIVQNSGKIIKEIEEDKFLNLYYQNIIAVFKKEINELPNEEYAKKVMKHIEIHGEFFSMIKDTLLYNVEHMAFIENFLKKKIEGQPVERDIVKILREIAQKRDINPDFIYSYLGKIPGKNY